MTKAKAAEVSEQDKQTADEADSGSVDAFYSERQELIRRLAEIQDDHDRALEHSGEGDYRRHDRRGTVAEIILALGLDMSDIGYVALAFEKWERNLELWRRDDPEGAQEIIEPLEATRRRLNRVRGDAKSP